MVAAPPDTPGLLTLELTALGRQGEALAETGDGKPVFVFGGVPGETVTAEIVAERRGYAAARVVETLTASPHRVEPECRYFGACTGCQWQHIAYERQLEMKRELLADAFRRVGGLDVEPLPTLPSPDRLGYRNHARFTVSKEGGRLGYVHKERRRHVEVDECLLMAPWINEALAALQGRAAETTQLSLRYGVNTGDYLLQPTLQNPEIPLASGQKHYEEELLGRRFRVSSPSFFQVNTRQAERMAELAMEQLGLDGSQTVVDAYAGVAVFAVLMAGRAKRVIAVEESAAALADARVNVEGVPNVELRQARTEDALLELASAGADAVLLDPPRAGCMPGALDALLDAPPPRVVYVSCDPETLARDLAVLTAGPFRIEQAQPVDMFPQTHHVEAVVTLIRDDERLARLRAREEVVLASVSPRRAAILRRLGVAFETADPGFAEAEADASAGAADAADLAQLRALAKAEAVASRRGSGTVIGADTVVELDGAPLGKPRDAADAARMLRALRGREHRVVTAVAFVDAATGESAVGHRASRVLMRAYGDGEIAAYAASGAPMDKAGAYGVQDAAFAPAAEVRGCYLNVVGLPPCETLQLAERFGLRLRPKPEPPWPELESCPACAKRALPPTLSGRGKR